MRVLDLLIETETTDLDWCVDPTELERELERLPAEHQPSLPDLSAGDHFGFNPPATACSNKFRITSR
jgi:hypothetical protein